MAVVPGALAPTLVPRRDRDFHGLGDSLPGPALPSRGIGGQDTGGDTYSGGAIGGGGGGTWRG